MISLKFILQDFNMIRKQIGCYEMMIFIKKEFEFEFD
jgi:hypothetical protein